MRAALKAEEAGVPAVSIVATGFLRQFQVTAKALGHPDLAIAHYHGTIPVDDDATLRDKVAKAVLPEVLKGLLRAQPDRAVVETTPEPALDEIVLAGTIDEINDVFAERLWSDGMPVIPPTLDRVEQFIRHTTRARDEVLGVLLPSARAATVWSVAVNGVMAGCRPEYMPLLIAIAEAIADPAFGIEHAGATPGWESMAIVSGPIVDDLDFSTETGLMRVGKRPNTTVGRFLRLLKRNVAGLIPGDTDKGTIGFTFPVAMAERTATLREIGWPTFGEHRGFSDRQSVVTVQSVVHVSAPIYTSGATPEEHLELLPRFFEEAVGVWGHIGIRLGGLYPTLLLSPAVARVFAEHGWSKTDIAVYVREHARVPARLWERACWHLGTKRMDLFELVASGRAPAEYAESRDPERLVPAIPDASGINIVVAGDPGRNQSKVYLTNHFHGAPVSRAVEWPG